MSHTPHLLEESSSCGFCSFQVLSQELADLKRRRAEARAENRALAKQEKTLKKRRARVLQVQCVGLTRAWGLGLCSVCLPGRAGVEPRGHSPASTPRCVHDMLGGLAAEPLWMVGDAAVPPPPVPAPPALPEGRCFMILWAVLSASFPQQVVAMLVEKLLVTLVVARMLLEVRCLWCTLWLSSAGRFVSGAEAAAVEVEAVEVEAAGAAGVAEGGSGWNMFKVLAV